jgi:osomolarity two-component system sensor histidine kinase SLN1
VGHTITIEEKEFRVRDISSQLMTIFDKTAAERDINLTVNFEGSADAMNAESSGINERKEFGPFGTGRVKDMLLWGDKTRILQVVINLTSNSLKFTPAGGSVTVNIRCLGDAELSLSRKASTMSKLNSGRNSRQRVYSSSETFEVTPKKLDTANEINAMENPAALSPSQMAQRTSSPPPGIRELMFEFEVHDTGPGVPDHLQKRIFEPFFQGDMQLSKKYSGTGLGLSICSQLATLMNGSMNMKSEENQGSTFTMRIPLKYVGNRSDSTASSIAERIGSARNSVEEISGVVVTDDTKPTRSLPTTMKSETTSLFESSGQPRLIGLSAPFFVPSTSPPATSQENSNQIEGDDRSLALKVLVADDNKTNQMVAVKMLRLENICEVSIAEDGQEAYDMVRTSLMQNVPYDLIFMDVQMPNMDGLQATRLIRQAGFSNPIVALSAYSDDTNVKGCKDAGMNDFVSKPIQIPRLKMVLKTFCPHLYDNDSPTCSLPNSALT